MPTEGMNPRFAELDLWPTQDAVAAMLEGQLAAAAAVRPAVDAIAAAAEAAAARLRDPAGRLLYAGAGTSGRLAVLDGIELGPTFDWGSERLVYGIAGGMGALVDSVENAEDDAAAGRSLVASVSLGGADVVIGVAASGRTPYTLGVVEAAATAGALTITIANNADAPLLAAAEHPILLDTGEELVAGSTRMKAGTAQKIALNLLSTAIMIRLGRVYKGLMVDMRLSNDKLRRRAVQIVAQATGVDAERAGAALEAVGGRIKPAILVASGADASAAERLLTEAGDDLRTALATLRSEK